VPLILTACGPGSGDVAIPIVGGYEYRDPGAYEKVITHKETGRPRQIVIDARVDQYKVVLKHSSNIPQFEC
jgi:hypothetical protein